MTPVSVVVAAWNEADSLPVMLDSLLAQTGVTIEAVVVANGCVDATAEVARAWIGRFAAAGHRLQVVEQATASKTAALRTGDAVVTAFPRAYVDADVTLSPSALAAVAAALAGPDPRVAAPRLSFAAPPDTARLAAFVERAPPFGNDVLGGGVYAVNAAGRARWGEFPDILADDVFVLGLFARHERLRVASAHFHARFPGRAHLPAVLVRWAHGNSMAVAAGCAMPKGRPFATVLWALPRPATWAQALLWMRLKLAARAEASRRAAGDFTWVRAS